jgi:hypothetical protein
VSPFPVNPSLYGKYEQDFKKENPLGSPADNRVRVRRQSSTSLAMGTLTRTPSSQYEELGSAI